MISAQEAYDSRKPEETTAFYDVLIRRGPVGQVAFGLFRAQKRSHVAKGYRRRRWRNGAYDAKGEALRYLNAALAAHGALKWGWGRDLMVDRYSHVLYVETPHGQVSFHSESNHGGPEFAGEWDGVREVSEKRVVRFCDDVTRLPQAPIDSWLLMPFGKNCGRPAVSLEREYLQWLGTWDGLNSWPTLRAYVHQQILVRPDLETTNATDDRSTSAGN